MAAAGLTALAVGSGLLGGAIYINSREAPIADEQLEYEETRSSGIMTSAYKAEQTIWSAEANEPLNQPTQRAKPGDVLTVQQHYAADVADFQTDQIRWNLQTPRTGRIPIQSAGYTPFLVQTLSTTKALSVHGGDTLVDNPTVVVGHPHGASYNGKEPVSDLTGWRDSDNTDKQKADFKSVLAGRRSPWAPGGDIIRLAQNKYATPVTRKGKIPKVAYINPGDVQSNVISSIKFQK